jgi:hypothetical protein
MKGKNLALFCLFFCGICLAQTTATAPGSSASPQPFEGQISVSTGLSTPSVAEGDTVRYAITLSWTGQSENYIFWPPEVPRVTGLEFSHMQTTNRKKSSATGYESSTEFSLFFLGVTQGEGSIGPLEIKYRSRGSEDFEYLHVPSQTVTISKRPKELPVRLLLKVLIAAGLIVILVIFYIRMRKQKRERIQGVEKPLQERLAERFRSLQAKRIAGEIAEYYHEIAIMLMDFLYETEELEAPVKSLHAFPEALERSEISPERKKQLSEIFNRCEQIRFSGNIPEPHEIDSFEYKIKEIFSSIK